MKRLLFALTLLIYNLWAQPPAEILNRVLYVGTPDGGSGSATLIDGIGDQQYLVTAYHLVESLPTQGNIKVLNPETLEAMDIAYTKVLKGDKSKVKGKYAPDVAVIVLRKTLADFKHLPVETGGSVAVGGDVFFLGYPLSYPNLGQAKMGQRRRLFPFVKKAVFSGTVVGKDDIEIFFFDGHNNKGFSGGPIVVRGQDGKYRLFAIVSGYLNDYPAPVSNAAGVVAQVTELNSGIIVAYGWGDVELLIKEYEASVKTSK